MHFTHTVMIEKYQLVRLSRRINQSKTQTSSRCHDQIFGTVPTKLHPTIFTLTALT